LEALLELLLKLLVVVVGKLGDMSNDILLFIAQLGRRGQSILTTTIDNTAEDGSAKLRISFLIHLQDMPTVIYAGWDEAGLTSGLSESQFWTATTKEPLLMLERIHRACGHSHTIRCTYSS